MIDLEVEKDRTIGTSDVMAVIHFSLQTAEQNGYISSFIFERSLLIYSISVFHPERADKIAKMMADDFGTTWDTLIEDGSIQKLGEEHGEDIDYILDSADSWFKEYVEYSNSVRGLVSDIQAIAGDTLSSAKQQLVNTMQETKAADVLNIANEWGINNSGEDVVSTPVDSMFK